VKKCEIHPGDMKFPTIIDAREKEDQGRGRQENACNNGQTDSSCSLTRSESSAHAREFRRNTARERTLMMNNGSKQKVISIIEVSHDTGMEICLCTCEDKIPF